MLGVQETADRPLEQALADALRDSHTCCWCWTTASTCWMPAPRWSTFCCASVQTLQVLATSREPIGIPGEVTWTVLAARAARTTSAVSVAEIERSPAVRLFVDRASAAQPSFALDRRQCGRRRADLSTAGWHSARAGAGRRPPRRAHARSSSQAAWTSASRLLTGGNRAALPRQQTLGATIDWSYLLLTETQQRVFERLSVFASGWTLEAAEAVCAGDGVAAEDVLDALLQLIRKSLVVRIDVRHGTARYGLLETLRQYALGQAARRGAELAADSANATPRTTPRWWRDSILPRRRRCCRFQARRSRRPSSRSWMTRTTTSGLR